MTASLHQDMPSDSADNETSCSSKSNHAIFEEYKDWKSVENKINNNDDDPDQKSRRLLSFHEAPKYLAHNKYILSGYRGILNTRLCLESIFWWTNETINIWSHIFGFTLFAALTIYDFYAVDIHAHWSDKLIVANVLLCFMVCMFFSTAYHTFSCRSENDFYGFLSLDLFGIAISLLAIYISGIYFAFWCHPHWRQFYIITVTVIFAMAMSIQLPRFNVDSNVKTIVFVAWAAYGVLPTIHWAIIMGGLGNPVVELLLPRVLGMYLISGTAFFIYVTKIPERFCAGKFDYLGHSHQWWHIIIVLALYFWHNSGIVYINYRVNHVCSDSMRLD